ncbi:TetR/AcrR family transcriptional regulator C-terminal domain-containing protein [Brevibacterium yomogidense]|uniref:Transcriptional regulator, TetR family n=1 Tax=Brevibacterium yomogidense TaxID=946573 RepID=A0A1X6XDG9_9MICO|nr:TetR/AcrR family transcriptional regulator C-terminal domain-containing protein [Brevibacterium yomogidense]SLM97209.1 Transcriptional regulator, TetR family [Brevibacterium yomogidense]
MSRGLNRTRVVEAATAYIDAHGAESLTMRRLGSHLGVEAMALYRHVEGKDQLLGAVVDRLVDDLLDDPRITSATDSWEEYLRSVGGALRELEAEHPRTFPLVATRPPEAPWLRPPLRSMRWVEHFLSSLLSHGFSHRRAVDAYKAFTSFLLGHLLLEASPRGGALSPTGAGTIDSVTAAVTEETGTAEASEDYPAVTELHDLLAADHADREFSDGLDALIERLRRPGL